MARKSSTLIKLCVMGSGRNHIHITNNLVSAPLLLRARCVCVCVCVAFRPQMRPTANCECERATLIERVQGLLRVSARYTVVMRLETLSCHTSAAAATATAACGYVLVLLFLSTRLSPENFLSARQSPSLKSTRRAAFN
jgi:hypothetical protein